ncbi:MAG: hypothetical protein Q3976_08050 [Corynebacterium sp.]|nr:hypothetical protein [Corynebacterium sp.]
MIFFTNLPAGNPALEMWNTLAQQLMVFVDNITPGIIGALNNLPL